MAFSFSCAGVLVIVLDEENIERLQQHDPFEFDQSLIDAPVVITIPMKLIIAYATKAEQETIKSFETNGGMPAMMAYLFRGYQFTETDQVRGKPYEKL